MIGHLLPQKPQIFIVLILLLFADARAFVADAFAAADECFAACFYQFSDRTIHGPEDVLL